MKLNNGKIQILMAEQFLTVTELATKAGLSRAFVTDCIKGNGNPKPASIGKLAKALNVAVQEIIMDAATSGESN